MGILISQYLLSPLYGSRLSLLCTSLTKVGIISSVPHVLCRLAAASSMATKGKRRSNIPFGTLTQLKRWILKQDRRKEDHPSHGRGRYRVGYFGPWMLLFAHLVKILIKSHIYNILLTKINNYINAIIS